MADKIRGITIELGADTSQLTKALKDVNSSISSTQKSLKDVDRLLKLDPKNTVLLTQKQELLSKQVEQTKDKVEQLKKVQSEMDAQGVDHNSEQYQALQREIIATEDKLKNLEAEYRNFGSVSVQQIAAVGKEMQEVGGKIEAAGQKLSGLSTAALGVETALVGLGIKAITTADDLNTMAAQTGLSTAEIQKFQYASDRIDVSLDTMVGALAKMKKNMTGQADTWERLHISVKNADGSMRNATDVFYEAVYALSQIENETERDQVAMALFGKSADQLAGIIDDGGQSLRQFGREAEQLGLIVSDEVLGSLNKTNDQIDKAKAQLQAALLQLGAVIGQVLAPTIEKITQTIQNVVLALQRLTPEQLKVLMIVTAIVAAIGPLLIFIGKIVSGIGSIIAFIPTMISGITAIMTAVSSLFTFLAANPYVLIISAIAIAVIALTVLIVKNIDVIKAALAEMGNWISNLFASIGQAITNAVNAVLNFIVRAVQAAFRLLQMLGAAAASFGGGGMGGSTMRGVRGMATGGTITSGSALVGENGPELLTMVGNRAQITPLTENQRGAALSQISGASGDVKVNVNFTGSLSQLARVLQPEIQVETNRRGVSLINA